MKETQTEHANFNWQRCIWRLRTSPKIKQLLWKGAVNALPVGDQLVRRGIDVSPLCKRCGILETTTHVFRDCALAHEVWNLAPFASNISEIQGPFLHLLSETKDLTVLPPAGTSEAHLCAWIFWFLWKARNELIFSDHALAPSEVLVKAIREARSWQEAQTHKEKPLNAPTSNLSIKKRNHGFYCHVDAAWSSNTLQCGMGWKISSYSNPLISFIGQEVALSIPSALSAEALALRTAILAATAVSCENIQFFSDNSTIVQLLRSHGDHKELHFLLNDIRDFSSSFNSFEIGYIPRMENVEANLLAKTALRGITSEFEL